MSVSGTAFLKEKPLSDARITLISKKGSGYLMDTLTAEDGSFTFDELDFSDDQPFVLRAYKNIDNQNIMVKLNDFSPPPVKDNFYPRQLYEASSNIMLPYLSHSVHRFDEMKKNGMLQDNVHELKDVVVSSKQLTKVQEAVAPSANLNGPGNADQVLTYEDLRYCNELSTCLSGKMRGVTIKLVIDISLLTSRTKTYVMQPFSSFVTDVPMLVVLDGMDISAAQGLDLRRIPANNIQSIEVLRSGAYTSVYGTRGAGGVLVITTKRGGINYYGNVNGKQQNNNLTFTTIKGYTAYRKFYSPDYSHPALSNSMPDVRSTVYWQPVIKTDENGKAIVNFYNAGNVSAYNIFIEGLSNNGIPGKAFLSYDVK